MASPNASFDDILATTMQRLQPDLFDNVILKNATTTVLKEYDSIKYIDGGPSVVEPIFYQQNNSYTRYLGPQPLSTASNQTFTAYQYQWKQIAINVQYDGLEVLKNSGRSQNKDLIKSRVMAAKTTYENNFNADMLSDGSTTNQIIGLALIIAADPTSGTLGGVSRTTYSFARNQFYRSLTDGGAVASASNLITYMDRLDLRIKAKRGNTKVILADENYFAFYEGLVHPLQRISVPDTKLGKTGFRAYQYKDAEVVFEPASAGMPASTMFFIDPEVLMLYVHSDRDLVRLPKRDSFNQDASIEYLAWCGCMGTKHAGRLGNLNNN